MEGAVPTAARELLPHSFFARRADVVARDLLGRVLVRTEADGGRTGGVIVETEAYRGEADPASHAFRGLTPRTAVMFGPPGFTYVYFTYGMHHCLNLVCERHGRAAAVLIRALAPFEGIARMRERRGDHPDHRLASGPGSLAKALGLTREHSGLALGPATVSVIAGRPRRFGRPVVAGPRIGIRAGLDRDWRFHLAGHPSVSGPRRQSAVDTPRRASLVSAPRVRAPR